MKLDEIVNRILQNQEFAKQVREKKQAFIDATDPDLKLSEADFLGLAFMTPAVLVAGADGKISWFEQRYLDKKARAYSQGRYLFFRDPVVKAVSILTKNASWEDDLLMLLKDAMAHMAEDEKIVEQMKESAQAGGGFSTVANIALLAVELYFLRVWGFLLNIMHGPIKIGKASISKEEKDKITHIIQKLGMSESVNYENLAAYLENTPEPEEP